MPHTRLITQDWPIFITRTKKPFPDWGCEAAYFNKPEHLHKQISLEHKASLKRQSSFSLPRAP